MPPLQISNQSVNIPRHFTSSRLPMASACTFILQPSLFHHSKLKQSNFLLQKFNIQIPNYRLSVLPSTSSDWEREEVRWIQEEQRWVREEKRWIREESRWRSERELLSKESDMLRIKIESLKTGTNMDGEVEVGGERLVIPEIMEVTGIIVEEKKEVEALAFEVNVSKRDNDMEKKIEERKVLKMEVQGGDVKKLQEAVNGASNNSVSKTTDANETIKKESSDDKFLESLHRVFLLGENRWEEPSRLKEREKFISGSNINVNCLTCHGEGHVICIECDGTGELNIEPQFIEWVDEAGKCPYCEGGFVVCDVCVGTGTTAKI